MIFNILIILMFFGLFLTVLYQSSEIKRVERFAHRESQRNRELLAENQRLEDIINEMIEEIK